MTHLLVPYYDKMKTYFYFGIYIKIFRTTYTNNRNLFFGKTLTVVFFLLFTFSNHLH